MPGFSVLPLVRNGGADIENRLPDEGGEQEGEGEMNGESSMDA